jgi:hypothetical protein
MSNGFPALESPGVYDAGDGEIESISSLFSGVKACSF